MRARFTKGTQSDLVEAFNGDGSAILRVRTPRKGAFPHDATHLVVERALRYRKAFWGRVAQGEQPERIAKSSKAAGHPSSRRATPPAPEVVELLQAERIVECFEAEIWGGRADHATFRSVLRAACAQSHLPEPALSDADVREIRDRLAELVAVWSGLTAGESMELTWTRLGKGNE